MSALVVTGASSFVGRHLLADLPAAPYTEVRLLAHDRPVPVTTAGVRVVAVKGDLLDSVTLPALVTPGATVLHLAHLPSSRPEQDHVAAARHLLAACREARIRRLVYCSTAAVAGAASDDLITEATPCRPGTGYERLKLRMEQEMQRSATHYELVVLRPSVIFGPGGRNLIALADRIMGGNRAVNFALSSLHGRRRLHLVSVHNVTAALGFLAASEGAGGETYILSDDDDPLNDYAAVESFLRRRFGRPRARSAAVASALLPLALRLRGRTDTNPRRIYSDRKLAAAGFAKPWTLERALAEFADWYLSGKQGQGCDARA